MRKFKHKLTGDVAELEFDTRYYLIKDKAHIPSRLIENSNDWEEVKEYPKIVSFRSKNNNSLHRLTGNNRFKLETGSIVDYSLEECLKSSFFEIYQVAVSETEVFTLGDKVKHPFTGGFDVVSKFIICKDPKRDVVIAIYSPDLIGKLVANVGDCFGSCNIEASKLEKAPEVLFVTEDGVEIFKGDKFYYISIQEPNPACYSGCAQEGSAMNTNYKYFSTVKAADQYIDENKPIYSKKQVRDALNNTFIGTLAGTYIYMQKYSNKNLDYESM